MSEKTVLIVAPSSASIAELIARAECKHGKCKIQIVWNDQQAEQIQGIKDFDEVVRLDEGTA